MKKVEIYYTLSEDAAEQLHGPAPEWVANSIGYTVVPSSHPRYSEALAHADVADDYAARVCVRYDYPTALRCRDSIPTIDEAIDALGEPPTRRFTPVLDGAGQVRS